MEPDVEAHLQDLSAPSEAEDRPVERPARTDSRALSSFEIWERVQQIRIRGEEAQKRYWEEEARRMAFWEDEE